MARRDVLRPGQHAEAAISRAAEEAGVVQAGKGAACGGGGPRTVNKAGGDGGEAGGNGGGRVAKELCKVQQPGDTVRGAGKAPAEEGEAKAGDAGEGSFHAGKAVSPGSREDIGRRLAVGEGDAHGGGSVNQGHAAAGSRGREGRVNARGNRSEGEKAGLGRVEVLASGGSKSIHSGEEGGELGGGLEQHLGIISIDAGGGSAGGTGQEVRDANTAGAQEGEEGLGDSQVEEWGKGAALAHTGEGGGGGRDEAVDNSTGVGARQQGPHEGEEGITKAKGGQRREEEATVDGVIGLAEVAENSEAPAPAAAQQVRQQLEGKDVGTDVAARDKGSLLRVDDVGEAGAKALGQQEGVQAVVGVQEGDGAIVEGVGAVARFV